MATLVRRVDPLSSVIASSVNALKAQIGAGANFHLDRSEVAPALPNASDLATAVALANELKAVYEFHLADALAHKLPDPPPALVKASDLATAITLANAIKTDFNVHIASTTYHYNADATNGTTSANASDLASLQTLVNEMKADMIAHMASGPSAPSLRLVDA
jgi:hypothetical protein